MKKKILAMLILLLSVLAFASCGSETADDVETAETELTAVLYDFQNDAEHEMSDADLRSAYEILHDREKWNEGYAYKTVFQYEIEFSDGSSFSFDEKYCNYVTDDGLGDLALTEKEGKKLMTIVESY